MNTQILEYVIAISEEKTLSKAAESLLVTQSALSQQLKKLEQELECPLFTRRKNTMQLTGAGKIYVNGARAALKIYYDAIREIKDLRTASQKELTIIYDGTLLPHFTAGVLPAFSGLHPGFFVRTVQGNSSQAKEYLMNNIAQLGIFASNERSHSMMDYTPLRSEELLLVLPAGHPCAEPFRTGGVDLSLLENERFILSRSGDCIQTLIQEIFQRRHFNPHASCEVDNLDAARHMVRNGEGVAFLPRSGGYPEEDFAAFPLTPPAEFQIVLACHKSTPLGKPAYDLYRLILDFSKKDRVPPVN